MAKFLKTLLKREDRAESETPPEVEEFPDLTLEDPPVELTKEVDAGPAVSIDGITLMACPENRKPSYSRARRVNTFSEVILLDEDGVAHVKTANGVTALLRRNFKVLSISPEHANVNGY
jgi:hypothetical protein